MDSSKDRRNFIKLLLTGGAVVASATIASGQAAPGSEDDKVKMLTEDGSLVEIDKAVFERIKSRKKAANSEIRDFVKSPKKQ